MPDSRPSQPELLYADVPECIRKTAYEVHCYFRKGFLEKVYEGALENRLRNQGLSV